MKLSRPKVLIPIAVLLVAVLIYVGNFMTGGATYSTNLGDLRAQFNRDKGKVRLLMLLAPS
jgi:hypothetical protein